VVLTASSENTLRADPEASETRKRRLTIEYMYWKYFDATAASAMELVRNIGYGTLASILSDVLACIISELRNNIDSRENCQWRRDSGKSQGIHPAYSIGLKACWMVLIANWRLRAGIASSKLHR
jgi:hypothetical protein